MSSTPPRRLRPRQARNPGAANGSSLPHADRESRSPSVNGNSDTDEYAPVSHKRRRAAAQGERKSKRIQKGVGFYKDPDTEDEMTATTGYPTPLSPPRARVAKSSAADRQLTKAAASPRKPAKKPKVTNEEPADPNVVIPDWTALPHHIWNQIFKEAAGPLVDRDSIKWLLKASRTNKVLTESALKALYACPPLLKATMLRKFLALIEKDPSTTTFNYRQMVTRLEFIVKTIFTRRGQQFNFGALVARLPRLAVVDFSHPSDAPPYKSLEERIRWTYPANFFQGLENTHLPGPDGQLIQVRDKTIRLTGFRWNRRLMGPGFDLNNVNELHLSKPFEYLNRISFVNFQLPSFFEVTPRRLLNQYGEPMTQEEMDAREYNIKARDTDFLKTWAKAICALNYLEHVSLEASAAVGEEFLLLLPKNLRSLELIACWEVTSDALATFLQSHGSQLEHLNLHWNLYLNLDFLTVLGEACPRLKTLVMDFKNYHHVGFFQDSEPLYDAVLSINKTPTWPTTLEFLELRNMKKWSSEAAEVLFQSIIDSAPKLPALRHLRIRSMLDEQVRDRSELRNKWRARFKRVFLRKTEDPRPFYSLRDIPPTVLDTIEPETTSRRSSRIASQWSSEPSSRASSPGKALRGGRVNYCEISSSDDESDEDNTTGFDSDEDEKEAEETYFRQGMCDIVDFRLDNMKELEHTLADHDLPEPDESDSDDDYF